MICSEATHQSTSDETASETSIMVCPPEGVEDVQVVQKPGLAPDGRRAFLQIQQSQGRPSRFSNALYAAF